jgi:hypothetical protein
MVDSAASTAKATVSTDFSDGPTWRPFELASTSAYASVSSRSSYRSQISERSIDSDCPGGVVVISPPA